MGQQGLFLKSFCTLPPCGLSKTKNSTVSLRPLISPGWTCSEVP